MVLLAQSVSVLEGYFSESIICIHIVVHNVNNLILLFTVNVHCAAQVSVFRLRFNLHLIILKFDQLS